MPHDRRFLQVDVFTGRALLGNPLAVVLDAQGLSDACMRSLASWTNLSETTFVLPPTVAGADYRVRIFTPGGELPFAGHPTLGSCHAWLTMGGQPASPEFVVQQCESGLIRIRRDGQRLAFEAPALRTREPSPAERSAAAQALGIDPAAILAAQWLDNGPSWLALRLADAQSVLALEPDHEAVRQLGKVGVVGPWAAGTHEAHFEVRAFAAPIGVPEDPVTGSLNAGLAHWLMQSGVAPDSYLASQGTRLGRQGRVHILREGGAIWVGGQVAECIRGAIRLDDDVVAS
ncbi:MAG TPA: PhzF family phenazine biosynthesis protein [Burkholderiaceae bacterium]|jgi:PhzF family phenazine biosynthesis protein|nr:PhzF family phenazine biosynthesis protein [Burkholderiaceae bacterium]